MNLTNHAKLRYVQRITGLQDERESRQYLAQNEEKVIGELNTMLEHAELVWSGKMANNKPSNYYLRDDVALVVDQNETLVTLFRCDFGFPEKINRQTIKNLVTEIHKLRQKSEKQAEAVNDKVAELEVTMENIDAQIRQAEAQLTLLKDRRANVETEILVVKQESYKTLSEIETIATMLFNSLDFRKDVLGQKFA